MAFHICFFFILFYISTTKKRLSCFNEIGSSLLLMCIWSYRRERRTTSQITGLHEMSEATNALFLALYCPRSLKKRFNWRPFSCSASFCCVLNFSCIIRAYMWRRLDLPHILTLHGPAPAVSDKAASFVGKQLGLLHRFIAATKIWAVRNEQNKNYFACIHVCHPSVFVYKLCVYLCV